MLMKTLTSFKCQKIQAKSDVIRENTSIKSITTEEVKGTGNTIAATCHHLEVMETGTHKATIHNFHHSDFNHYCHYCDFNPYQGTKKLHFHKFRETS